MLICFALVHPKVIKENGNNYLLSGEYELFIKALSIVQRDLTGYALYKNGLFLLLLLLLLLLLFIELKCPLVITCILWVIPVRLMTLFEFTSYKRMYRYDSGAFRIHQNKSNMYDLDTERVNTHLSYYNRKVCSSTM